jgi:hypothetical protein
MMISFKVMPLWAKKSLQRDLQAQKSPRTGLKRILGGFCGVGIPNHHPQRD